MNNDIIINFDINGYPTDECIESITCYIGNWKEFIYKISPLFEQYGKCDFNNESKIWSISTGGWSGNEDVLNAMQENILFWSMTWRLSRRGGHYEFKT